MSVRRGRVVSKRWNDADDTYWNNRVYEDLDGQRASTSVMEPNLETPPVTWILPVESPPASASSSAPRIKDNRL